MGRKPGWIESVMLVGSVSAPVATLLSLFALGASVPEAVCGAIAVLLAAAVFFPVCWTTLRLWWKTPDRSEDGRAGRGKEP